MEELDELGRLLKKERRFLDADTVDMEAVSQNLSRIEELFRRFSLNPGNPELVKAGEGKSGEEPAERLREIFRLRRENMDILQSRAKDMGKQIKAFRKSGKALLTYTKYRP